MTRRNMKSWTATKHARGFLEVWKIRQKLSTWIATVKTVRNFDDWFKIYLVSIFFLKINAKFSYSRILLSHPHPHLSLNREAPTRATRKDNTMCRERVAMNFRKGRPFFLEILQYYDEDLS